MSSFAMEKIDKGVLLRLENDSASDACDAGGGRGGLALVLKNDTRSDTLPPKSEEEAAKTTAPPKRNGTSGGEPVLSLLVEIASVLVPDRKQGTKQVHSSVYWVGPANPSGYRRREFLVHRTLSLRSSSPGGEEADDDEASSFEDYVLTVDDGSLFLFNTSMKQLVNSSRPEEYADRGGLRFDVFTTPLDLVNSLHSTVSSMSSVDSVKEKEKHAISNDNTTASSMSYRLVGSVFLSAAEIMARCDEQRYNFQLMDNWRTVHQRSSRNALQRAKTKRSLFGGRLALRFRLASQTDIALLDSMAKNRSARQLQSDLIRNYTEMQPADNITEVDEASFSAESSVKHLLNISPVAKEAVRKFWHDTEKRIMVKPYPDERRKQETTWFTEERLHQEAYMPSSNWIQAGHPTSNSIGRVYLEIIRCQGLPNTDTGGAVGNKTDAFVTCTYDSVMTQTDVIDDACSPMWMPWCTRAFIFQLTHPSHALYIAVTDYDLGPQEHENIGRVTVNLSNLSASLVYTLTYKLYPSSNLTERGDDQGNITIRLRLEIDDPRRYLLAGAVPVEGTAFICSQQWKTHRVTKYCTEGPHDEEVFEMSVFRSYINEIMTAKRHTVYVVSDGIKSLVFWRGQVRVGGVRLPLHSMLVFYLSTIVIEKPRLLPSYFLFGCAWILITNMLNKQAHPSPWRRGHSLAEYLAVLLDSASGHRPREIEPYEGSKEALKLEEAWKKRIADDDANYSKQALLDAKVEAIQSEAVIRTRTKAKNLIEDPVSSLAGNKLLPYQQRLSRYCMKIRLVRNVLNWEESPWSFFLTMALLGASFVALFIPWGLICKWSIRIAVYGLLGPWMALFDVFFHEESERAKGKAASKAVKAFLDRRRSAKLVREGVLKLKAFRTKLFGNFITRVAKVNLSRHIDVPEPQSFAELYHCDNKIKSCRRFIPSQDIGGVMIPRAGYNSQEVEALRDRDKELQKQFRILMSNNVHLTPTEPEETSDESFELVQSPNNQVVCMVNHDASIVKGEDQHQAVIREDTKIKSIRASVGSKEQSWVLTLAVSLRQQAVAEQHPALDQDDACGSNTNIGGDTAEQGIEVDHLSILPKDEDVAGSPEHTQK
mmetsp:Transcript_8253/g.17758  ORF Transcript_8253/g.17758 Transcript_8253/m.17758 type:complete len:1105 (-) Transcript_8253:213-3527(-)